MPLRLVDTAGLRETECVVEQEGVRRARVSINRADLNLHVIDGSMCLSEEDRTHIGGIDGSKCIVVLNKTDIGMAVTAGDFPNHTVIHCCLLKKVGLDDVRQTIVKKLKLHGGETAHAVISERHRQYIQNALNVMNDANKLLKTGNQKNSVLVAQHLRTVAENIGAITGRIYTNELLDNLFRRFCTGK